jgi:transposase
MIKIEFLEQDLKTINEQRFSHPVPLVQRRMEALWLKSQGLSHKQIVKLADVSINSLTKYLRLYRDGGLDAVRNVNFYRPESDLEQHKVTIEQYFLENPVASIAEARAKIEELTGIRRSKTQVGVFLKKLGLRYRKVGSVPSGADLDEQEAFKKNILEPRIEEAKAGKRHLFFMDAAHFVFAPFLGYLWCFTRLFIKAPSGRKRFNVLGALNAITHEMITVTNTGYINAVSVCQLLMKISQICKDHPVTIVLDNARYQKCKLVIATAKLFCIELLYLPPYSPNLNLIERVWKFVKKKCLYSKYYPDFNSFADSISDCLAETSRKYRKELYTLLSLNFQIFDKSQIITD